MMVNQGTSDYFNSCSNLSSGVSIPNNSLGFHEANDGDAYAGFVITSDTNVNYREYLKIKLKRSLQQGSIYNISFFISFAGTNTFCSTSKIGFLFTQDSLPNYTATPIFSSEAIYADLTSIDTSSWIKCSISYLANDSYEYLVIGDFSMFDSLSLIPLNSTTSCNAAYVFVDNFVVVETNLVIPNVFTPNDDDINDKFIIQGLPLSTKITILNRWGNIVFQSNNASVDFWDGTIQGNQTNEGVYYYIINNNFINKTGFVQLIR